MSNVRLSSACGLLVALAFAGCGDKYDGRMEVSGQVALKKQQIKDGATVIFEPLEKQGTGTNIATTGGAYKIPHESGLKPGKYLVRVTLGDVKQPVNVIDPGSPPGPGGGTNVMAKELVPKEWNVNSKQEVTVTKDGPNVFDFDIP